MYCIKWKLNRIEYNKKVLIQKGKTKMIFKDFNNICNKISMVPFFLLACTIRAYQKKLVILYSFMYNKVLKIN